MLDELLRRVRSHSPTDLPIERSFPEAAVLVPVTRSDDPELILTLRASGLSTHGGEVAFPGGRRDPEDRDLIHTALREAEEEIGLPPGRVTLVGTLDTYETRTGFEIVPVVGLVAPPFAMRLDAREVAEVFEVPLAFILDPANHERHSRVFQGVRRQFYAMPYGERYIWGATAGMLINLYEVLAATGGVRA